MNNAISYKKIKAFMAMLAKKYNIRHECINFNKKPSIPEIMEQLGINKRKQY